MLQFSPNCTLPGNVVNFVSTPNARGTLDILWASLTTLFLCTWTVQHPNLPIERPPRSIRARISALAKKVGMMITTLIAPEFMLLKAIADYTSSKILEVEMGWRAERDCSRWSQVHSYFVNMGGFVVQFKDDLPCTTKMEAVGRLHRTLSTTESDLPRTTNTEAVGEIQRTLSIVEDATKTKTAISTTKDLTEAPSLACQKPTTTSDPKGERQIPSTGTHEKILLRILNLREASLPPSDEKNTELVKNGLMKLRRGVEAGQSQKRTVAGFDHTVNNLVRLRGSKWALDGAQLVLARQMGLIDRLPNITADEIEDKSSGDYLVKLFAVLQAGWQIVQLIKRLVQHQELSQIEIVTIAYAVLTLFIYMFFWKKPQDVGVPVFVPAARHPTVDEMIKLADVGPVYTAALFLGYQYSTPEHVIHRNIEDTEKFYTGGKLSWLGGIFGAVLFGLLHALAWNLQFPTLVERLLWRIATLASTCLPIFYGVYALIVPFLQKVEHVKRLNFIGDLVMPGLGYLVGSAYLVSRLFLLTDTLRSLFFLSPQAFAS